MQNFRARVMCPRTFLFAILIALPCGARAADMSFGGDSGCSDPPIFSNLFTLPSTSSGGGLCRAFGNHSGGTFSSLKFTAAFPTTITDPFLCSPAPFFLSCDFVVDGTTTLQSGDFARGFGSTVTVEFFGNSDHPGIPVATSNDPANPLYFNFFINLNNPTVCPPATLAGVCTQPNTTAGSGDWGIQSFAGAANGATVPEPGSLVLLLSAVGAMIARYRWRERATASGLFR